MNFLSSRPLTLVSAVAHEINNPLMYISGAVELAQKECRRFRADPDLSVQVVGALEQYLETIRSGVERIAAIVRSVLGFVRPEATMQHADLARCIKSAVDLVRPALRKKATLVEQVEALPLVRGNEALLGQVMLNLLTNALQALGDGDPTRHEIRISARREDERVVVEVSDSGRGIPADVLPRIFDPFFTTKKSGEGTGLGLSISKEIVESCGGAVLIQSLPEQGTTVRIELLGLPTADV